MTKQLYLTGKYGSIIGNYAIVDDDVYDELSKYKWYGHRRPSGNIYVHGFINGKKIPLHRYLLKINDPKIKIDHINHNTLDHCLRNLRLCTNQQNSWNTKTHKDNKTQHKGVVKQKSGKYKVEIMKDGYKIVVGIYSTAKEGAIAYDIKAKELYGEFAYLNFPNNDYTNTERPKSVARRSSTGYKNIHNSTNPNYQYRAEIVIRGKTYTQLCNDIETGLNFLSQIREKYQ